MKDKLKWWQEVIVMCWYIWDVDKYNYYIHWINSGMRRKYAFEKIQTL